MTVIDPAIAMVPDHVPDALHDVACPVDQVKVALWPGATVAGLMEMLMKAGWAG
jgi:hypothetical protein